MANSYHPVDIGYELRSKQPRPAERIDRAFLFEDQTPAHKFTYVVAEVETTPCCVVLAAKDHFDPDLAAAIIRFTREHHDMLNLESSLTILETFSFPGYRFDALLLLGPKAQAVLESRSSILQSRAIQTIPIYRCEFTGDETVDILYTVRKRFVQTLDWLRAPAPRIVISFWTATIKADTKPGLSTLDNTLFYIHEVARSGSGAVDAQNYRGERIQIVFNSEDSTFKIDLLDQKKRISVPSTEIDDWLRNFVCPSL